MAIPKNYRLVFGKSDIQQAICNIAAPITIWADRCRQETGIDPVALPVLRGGIFFFADLVREVKASVEIHPVQTWAYELSQNEQMRPKVEVDLKTLKAAGRRILMLDDVCDSGKTLQALTAALMEAGAAEVRSAVLIKRELEEPTFDPDWVGLTYKGKEWFVGYGLEDQERWRNLPEVYVIEKLA